MRLAHLAPGGSYIYRRRLMQRAIDRVRKSNHRGRCRRSPNRNYGNKRGRK
jgi:hypothetical protein